MIHLLPEERNEVARYIYSLCSITLDASKDYLIEGRLNRLAGRNRLAELLPAHQPFQRRFEPEL